MAEKFKQQQEIRERILRLRENIKKDGSDRKSKVEYYKSRSNQLNELWTEFLIIHERFGKEESRSHEYFVTNFYGQTKEIYEEITRLINAGYTKLTATLAGVSGTSFSSKTEEIQDQEEQGFYDIDTSPQKLQGEGGASQPPGDSEHFDINQMKKQDRGSSSKLDELYRKQWVNIKAFLRTVSNINIELLTEKWELDDALKTLESRWSVIDSSHWEIEGEATHSDFTYLSMFDKQEKTFCSLKKEINKKIWSVAHREKSTPQLDIPVFHGNYNSWYHLRTYSMR